MWELFLPSPMSSSRGSSLCAPAALHDFSKEEKAIHHSRKTACTPEQDGSPCWDGYLESPQFKPILQEHLEGWFSRRTEYAARQTGTHQPFPWGTNFFLLLRWSSLPRTTWSFSLCAHKHTSTQAHTPLLFIILTGDSFFVMSNVLGCRYPSLAGNTCACSLRLLVLPLDLHR